MYDIWHASYPDSSGPLSQEAINAWVANAHDPSDWYDFFNHEMIAAKDGYASSTRTVPVDSLIHTMGSDAQAWQLCWNGLNIGYPPNQFSHRATLDVFIAAQKMPYAALEGLLHLVESDPYHASGWSRLLLSKPPSWMFMHLPVHDLREPLHRLSTVLLENCPIPLGRLPSLQWSPSALYDDYGLPPEDLIPREKAIQHMLEYAVCQKDKDPLSQTEWCAYARRVGLDPEGLEVFLELSSDPKSRTLGDVVRTIESMMNPIPMDTYEISAIMEPSQP
jgi:hypothetical protein